MRSRIVLRSATTVRETLISEGVDWLDPRNIRPGGGDDDGARPNDRDFGTLKSDCQARCSDSLGRLQAGFIAGGDIRGDFSLTSKFKTEGSQLTVRGDTHRTVQFEEQPPVRWSDYPPIHRFHQNTKTGSDPTGTVLPEMV